MKSVKQQLIDAWTVEGFERLAEAVDAVAHGDFRRAAASASVANRELWKAADLSTMGSGSLPGWAATEARVRGISRGR